MEKIVDTLAASIVIITRVIYIMEDVLLVVKMASMVKGVLKVMIFCIFYSDIMHALFKVMLFVLHFNFFKRMCNNADLIPRISFFYKVTFCNVF